VHGCPLARLGTRDSGGMNVYVHRLASALGRLGCQVDIFTRVHNTEEPSIVELDENTRLIHLEAGPVDAPKADLVHYLPDFLSQLKGFQQDNGLVYDTIHSHYWLSGWVGNELATEWGVPHVATFHTLAEVKNRARVGEGDAGPRSGIERSVTAAADGIVVSTGHERAALAQLYDMPEEKVYVIPAGVDLDLFKPGDQAAARDQLGLNGDRMLLYVGRLEPIKGLEVLMYTLGSMEESGNVRLLVIGGDGEHDEGHQKMMGLAKELNIEDRVDFLGSLSHGLLPLYYQAVDVCVVPSYYESFGLVALEAMACGTPVVGSRVPGLETIVRDNWSGYLVPWHCPDAFVDRIEVLLANEDLRHSMGEEAQVTAAGMSWDRMAVSVAEVYAELEEHGTQRLPSPLKG
jgi:D-inositol-3-phosphate glycosyltransferase